MHGSLDDIFPGLEFSQHLLNHVYMFRFLVLQKLKEFFYKIDRSLSGKLCVEITGLHFLLECCLQYLVWG